MHASKRAFTLVEMSIIIVIIGLLVGGVMVGKTLIHATQLRSVATSFLSYETGIQTFRDQYNALPGDMPNATAYWTTATNGAGTGYFPNFGGGALAWQHLQYAGLIIGNLPGTQANGASGTCLPGTECPAIKVDTLLSFFTVANVLAGTPPYTTGNKNGVFLYDGTNIDNGLALKPVDAYTLDLKLDDGLPGSGKLYGFGVGGFYGGDGWDNCSVDAVGSAYAVAGTTNACRVFFTIK